MKASRTIEVVVCDVCGENAYFSCCRCGKDLCADHTVTVLVDRDADDDDAYKELCPDCIEALKQWLNGNQPHEIAA